MKDPFPITCFERSQKTLNWVIQQIEANGKIKSFPDDLVGYYKLPYLLTTTGHPVLAKKVFDYMQNTFFTQNGMLTFDNKKTENLLMAKFWGYVLGWVAIAAQKAGRFDLSFPLHHHLTHFQSQDHGGFATSGAWGKHDEAMDVITTAQLGRLSLFFGMKFEAIKAGEFLSWNINHQPKLTESLYLFVNNDKKHILKYPREMEMIYVVNKSLPNQAYFMIGLPCAFLVDLFLATKQAHFLNAAKQYADFALECHESIKSFHFSHKVAYAMAMLYRYTKEEKYLSMCKSITEYLIQIQDEDGIWLRKEGQVNSFDQSLEIAIWLNEIHTHLA
ncbi:MAG: hypothetical protein ACHQJ6_06750 [Candidatus Berkiellales bacterium]